MRAIRFDWCEVLQIWNAAEVVKENEWSKSVVLPIRNKFKHENLMIDADLVAIVEK